MLKVIFGGVMLLLGLWLFLGDPGKDPQGQYLGSAVHHVFLWLSNMRPFSTILAFVFAVASFIMIKKY